VVHMSIAGDGDDTDTPTLVMSTSLRTHPTARSATPTSTATATATTGTATATRAARARACEGDRTAALGPHLAAAWVELLAGAGTDADGGMGEGIVSLLDASYVR
jgi:hypothetical protein